MKFHVEFYTFDELDAIRPEYTSKHRIEPQQLFLFEKGCKSCCAIITRQWLNNYIEKWKKEKLNYLKGKNTAVMVLPDLIVGADRFFGLRQVDSMNFKTIYNRLVSTNSYNRINELQAQTHDKTLDRKLGMNVEIIDDISLLHREVNRRGKLIGWTLDSIGLKIYRSPNKTTVWVMDCIKVGVVRMPLCGVEVTQDIFDNVEESRIMARYVLNRLISMKNEIPEVIKMISGFQ